MAEQATFTIKPTPADAEVIINGELTSSLVVNVGTSCVWQVSATGYVTQSGEIEVSQDIEIPVTLTLYIPEVAPFDYSAYLANLLIIQYHNKPKAVATIKALGQMFPTNLILSVINGFSLESAVGKQLDILGKYIGVDRWYNNNGQYAQLTDEQYRFLLKFKAIANNSDMSYLTINTSLYNFFGTRVRISTNGNMQMTYFVPKDATEIIVAAIQKEVLPRPMGVEVNYVIEYSYNFFGFCTYSNQYAIYKTGFRTYDNPDKVGEFYTYDKNIEV